MRGGVQVFLRLPDMGRVESVTDQVSHVTWSTCRVADAVSAKVIPDGPVGLADIPSGRPSDDLNNN
jgi:hypothetical protein